MIRFDRSFPVDGAWADKPGIRTLFSRWALPGEPAGERGLRIGIRDRYLNLYAKGQSVVKLTIDRGSEPRIEVHPVYVAGLAKGAARPDDYSARYVKVPIKQVNEAAVDRWTATALTYASAEKRFVDDLVAANPGTLDLEMGLPKSEPGGTAPRMDLVIAQDGAVAFWEAKCSNNPELRARAAYEEDANGAYVRGIQVIHQLRKYQRWMTSERAAQVACAYRRAAMILLALADLFDRPGAAARDAWRRLASTDSPAMILPPAIVIGDYRPEGHARSEWERTNDKDYFAHLAGSFGEFKMTIESHGARVQCFATGDAKVLPPLSPGEVRATPEV